MEYGDYVEPIRNEEAYIEFLKSLGIQYEDLFGIVVGIKPTYEGLSISIRSLRTGEVSHNWNAKFFRKAEVSLALKDRYEYILNTSDGNIGLPKIK